MKRKSATVFQASMVWQNVHISSSYPEDKTLKGALLQEFRHKPLYSNWILSYYKYINY